METSKFHSNRSLTKGYDTISKMIDEHTISSDEGKILKEFVEYQLNTRGKFSESRAVDYINNVRSIYNRFLIPNNLNLLTMSFPEFLSVVGMIKRAGYAENTVFSYLTMLKFYFKWLIKNGYNTNASGSLEKLKEIQIPQPVAKKIDNEKILTKDEVLTLISKGGVDTMERCMFAVCYELALRPDELCGLKWKDVEPEGSGCFVTVHTTKTKYPRRLWLEDFYSHLLEWRNNTTHGKPDDYIFFSKRGSHFTYVGLWQRFKNRLELTGIKDVGLYVFRHSRAAHLLSEGLPENTIKMILEGHVDTEVMQYYITPNDDMIRDTLKRHNGTLPEKIVEKPLHANICERCHYVNSPDAEYCSHCGNPLSEDKRELHSNLRKMMSCLDIEYPENSNTVENMSDEELIAELKRRFTISKGKNQSVIPARPGSSD